jgi:site-specific recombinase XerC
MDVISLCRDVDTLIRRSEQARRRDQVLDDCRALLDQVEWLDAGAASEEDPARRAGYAHLSAELLQLHDRAGAEACRGQVVGDLLYSAGAALADTASYAASVRAIRVARLPGLRIHDLRHSAASFMVNSGIDLFAVGKVLGHASYQSTQRYSHLAQDTLLKAVEAGAAKQKVA